MKMVYCRLQHSKYYGREWMDEGEKKQQETQKKKKKRKKVIVYTVRAN